MLTQKVCLLCRAASGDLRLKFLSLKVLPGRSGTLQKSFFYGSFAKNNEQRAPTLPQKKGEHGANPNIVCGPPLAKLAKLRRPHSLKLK